MSAAHTTALLFRSFVHPSVHFSPTLIYVFLSTLPIIIIIHQLNRSKILTNFQNPFAFVRSLLLNVRRLGRRHQEVFGGRWYELVHPHFHQLKVLDNVLWPRYLPLDGFEGTIHLNSPPRKKNELGEGLISGSILADVSGVRGRGNRAVSWTVQGFGDIRLVFCEGRRRGKERTLKSPSNTLYVGETKPFQCSEEIRTSNKTFNLNSFINYLQNYDERTGRETERGKDEGAAHGPIWNWTFSAVKGGRGGRKERSRAVVISGITKKKNPPDSRAGRWKGWPLRRRRRRQKDLLC